MLNSTKKAIILAIFTLFSAPVLAADAPKKSDERFERADVNHDGKLSKEEFSASAQERADKRFKELDANADSVVTKEELQAARKARKAKNLDVKKAEAPKIPQ